MELKVVVDALACINLHCRFHREEPREESNEEPTAWTHFIKVQISNRFQNEKRTSHKRQSKNWKGWRRINKKNGLQKRGTDTDLLTFLIKSHKNAFRRKHTLEFSKALKVKYINILKLDISNYIHKIYSSHLNGFNCVRKIQIEYCLFVSRSLFCIICRICFLNWISRRVGGFFLLCR